METSAYGKSKKYDCTLNWKAAIFVKIFFVKITDYFIHQNLNFAPSNFSAIRYFQNLRTYNMSMPYVF